MSVHIQHSMSVDKKRVCTPLKTAALALLIICIFALPCVIQARWVNTNEAYQKELAWKLGTMPLMYYECTLIDSDTEDKETRIHFMLNTHQPYSLTSIFFTQERGAAEIARIQQAVSEYLQEHPDCEMNSHCITLYLDTTPGECIELTNFDPETGERYEPAYLLNAA